MRSKHTIRAKTSCSLIFMGLAVLIFAWGLQYKLSLYAGPDSAVRHMVQAKLFTNDKVALPDAAITTGHADSVHPALSFVPGALFIPLLALSLLTAACETSLRISAPLYLRRDRSQAALNAFFFRPPPRL